jgi:hypothetical protein
MEVQEDRVRKLREKIAELRARLPRHSVPPAMLIELEELEDELKRLVPRGKSKENEADHG